MDIRKTSSRWLLERKIRTFYFRVGSVGRRAIESIPSNRVIEDIVIQREDDLWSIDNIPWSWVRLLGTVRCLRSVVPARRVTEQWHLLSTGRRGILWVRSVDRLSRWSELDDAGVHTVRWRQWRTAEYLITSRTSNRKEALRRRLWILCLLVSIWDQSLVTRIDRRSIIARTTLEVERLRRLTRSLHGRNKIKKELELE